MKGFVFGVLVAATGAVSTAAADFSAELVAAQRGDYEAQRNVAYMLDHGDGVGQNPLEACAWRLVVATTQGPLVTETDSTQLECVQKFGARPVEARARAIAAIIPAKQRTINTDIAALTDGNCPGAKCTGAAARFASIYREAVSGSIQAMRDVTGCFNNAETCNRAVGYNALQGCIWTKTILVHLGQAATADDRQRERLICAPIAGNTTDILVRAGQAAIRTMMTAQNQPSQTNRRRGQR